MSSNGPCAVYNFYNCCNGSGASAQSAGFIWQSSNLMDPSGASTATQEALQAGFIFGNVPNAALKAYQGLTALHRKAQLKDISLFRLPNTQYNSTINLDLVVIDVNGVFIRQISTATLNYLTIPVRTWTPISLSSVAGDLDILPGQVVAGQLTFGAALPPGSPFVGIYQLSGTGVLL